MTGAGKKSGNTGGGRGRGRGRGRGSSRGRGSNPPPDPPRGPQQLGAYDGPSEQRGRSPSTSKPSSRASSKGPDADQGKKIPLPKGYDPVTRRAPELLKNVDFGGGAYALSSEVSKPAAFLLGSYCQTAFFS